MDLRIWLSIKRGGTINPLYYAKCLTILAKKRFKVPTSNHILFLPGFSIKKVIQGSPLVINATYNIKPQCPHCCGRKLRIKDTFERRIRHESIGERCTTLIVKAHKFYCHTCKRYFNQRFNGILPYQRATERFKKQIFQQHTHGVSQKEIAAYFRLGAATVERWYHQGYQLQNQYIKHRHWPTVLGLDEHFFKKRQFATTFCDLRKNKVFDIAHGKSKADIIHAFQHIPGRERVKVVCIDLSTHYRSFTKQYFPHAMIVADRFHVIRLVEHAFMQTIQSILPSIKYQRGTLAMLRTKPNNLSDNKKIKIKHFMDEQPAIEALYQFKLRLIDLLMWKKRKKVQCYELAASFLEFIHKLKNATFEPLVKLGKTLYKWKEEIARMWRFTKNNGITEGFHRKMKLIQRRAYGFKNFENYRLRVKVLCS